MQRTFSTSNRTSSPGGGTHFTMPSFNNMGFTASKTSDTASKPRREPAESVRMEVALRAASQSQFDRCLAKCGHVRRLDREQAPCRYTHRAGPAKTGVPQSLLHLHHRWQGITPSPRSGFLSQGSRLARRPEQLMAAPHRETPIPFASIDSASSGTRPPPANASVGM